METIVYSLSPGHIFYSCQTFLLIALGVHSESCKVQFFYFRNHLRRFSDFIGSITKAIKGSALFWKSYCVFTSMPDNQHPKLGCEWYQPTIWCVFILLNHSVYAMLSKNYMQSECGFSHQLSLLSLMTPQASRRHH